MPSTVYDQINSEIEYRAPFVTPFAEFCEGCRFWGDTLEENAAGGVRGVVKFCALVRLRGGSDQKLVLKMARGYMCRYYMYKLNSMISKDARR